MNYVTITSSDVVKFDEKLNAIKDTARGVEVVGFSVSGRFIYALVKVWQ